MMNQRDFLAILRHFFLLYLLILWPLGAHADCCKLVPHWQTVTTEHFAIHYYEGEESVAQKLMPMSEEVYETLTHKLGVQPKGRTEVTLVSHRDVAQSLSWSNPYRRMLLWVSPPLSDRPEADYHDWLRELFIREYSHILFLSDAAHAKFPTILMRRLVGALMTPSAMTPDWMSQGLSVYFQISETTGKSAMTEMILRTDILQKKFLRLDQMAGSQIDWPGPLAGEVYGGAFWQYLSERYGEEKIFEFIHRMGASPWNFTFNHKAKKVFRDSEGNRKSFHELWKDWKVALETRYEKVRETITREGLKEGTPLWVPQKWESVTGPTVSPDGHLLVYLATSIHHPSEVRVKDLTTGHERILLHKKEVRQFSFTPEGDALIVSYLSSHWGGSQISDVHEINLKTGHIKDLTRLQRIRDPDVSPDGNRIVAIKQVADHSLLVFYDRKTQELREGAVAGDWDHPRWLPDGHSVVVSGYRHHQRNLWIVDAETGQEKQITFDASMNDFPSVDVKSGRIYFSSDRTGIPNIYSYDLKSGHINQVTHVLTGALAPSVMSEGELIFQFYNGRGFEIRTLSVGEAFVKVENPEKIVQEHKQDDKKEEEIMGVESLPSKNYRSFQKLFIPNILTPKIVFVDGAFSTKVVMENFDPLKRHVLKGDVTYRNDNRFIGYDGEYTYSRFFLPLSVGYNDYTVNYGDVFDLRANFFEERRQAFVGMETPPGSHQFSAKYFFENRRENAGLPAGSTLLTLGNYAGFLVQYSFKNTAGTAAAISPEEGINMSVNYEVSNGALGASKHLQQQVVWGDSRVYLKIPFLQHHVLALRAGGGAAFGDLFVQGNFGLGGSAGEGPYTAKTSRFFTLRGIPFATFSRDLAWVGSAEYRFPLLSPQLGFRTFPLALTHIHMVLFSDAGDALDSGESSFRPIISVGGEVRSDFVIAYHLPLTFRVGYGLLLTQKDRVAREGINVQKGLAIIDIGTSF